MPYHLAVGERITTFDPGGTTGACSGTYLGEGRFSLDVAVQILWDDFAQMEALMLGADWVVVERFALYASKARDQINSEFPSAQWIGAIRHHAWQLGTLDKVVIMPAAARLVAKVLPEHAPMLTGPHARDAYMHLRYFCIVNKRYDRQVG